MCTLLCASRTFIRTLEKNRSTMSSILQKIVQQRLIDVQKAKENTTLEQLQARLHTFTQIDFYARIQRDVHNKGLAVMAEVKRASPSKGDIAPHIVAADQGLSYATAGATVISCLTEPTWFKGTLQDMTDIRTVIESVADRPALLRKDFIVDEYQIYEARACGADSLLLIVAALTHRQLVDYLKCARSLGMEPLVEVNTDEEMRVAVEIGAKLIGINNRNLHTFTVDLNTTGDLLKTLQNIPQDIIFAALSGIVDRKDVEFFSNVGVHAILVGETLMRAQDPKAKLKELRGDYEPLVKICGLTSVEEALEAVKFGADLIGLIFAPQSKRKVSTEVAKQIVAAVNQVRGEGQVAELVTSDVTSKDKLIESWFNWLASATKSKRPLVVGVFADQPLDEVKSLAQETGIDVIQLSGAEEWSFIPSLSNPVLRAVHVAPAGEPVTVETLPLPNCPVGLLLDAVDPNSPHLRGGTGQQIAWGRAAPLARSVPLALAGGLKSSNVAAAVRTFRPRLVDVASGVEISPGKKDLEQVKLFIYNAKHAFDS